MTSPMFTVFDEPQWKWLEQSDHDPNPIRITPVCIIRDGVRALNEDRMSIPAEFYHYLASVHSGDAYVSGFTLQRVTGGRVYFSYDYDSPHERQTVTLWYYTKSNLPYWAKRYFK